MLKAAVVVCFLMGCYGLGAQSTTTIPAVRAADVRRWMDTCSQPTVIAFWASWCGPCLRELPELERQVAATGGQVTLLLVSLDVAASYPTALQAFVEKQQYKYPVVFLSDIKTADYAPVIDSTWNGAIPASVFINRSKNHYRFIHHQLTPPRLQLELKEILP